MFYKGDLQAGIALALQESKSVACFICDESAESAIWQNDFLGDDEVSTALYERAVTLRLNSDSQEATYLKAYYPVQGVPSFIIIHNGRLILDLRVGTEQPGFKAAILKAFNSLSAPQEPAEDSSIPSPPQEASPGTSVIHSNTTSSIHQQDGPSSATPPTPTANNPTATASPPNTLDTNPDPSSSNTQRNSTVDRLLAERRQKLEKRKRESEAADRAERKAQAEARNAALASDPTSTKGKQASYAQQQKVRKREQQLERERILRQIEHDRQERREKEERRKAATRAQVEGEAGGQQKKNEGVGQAPLAGLPSQETGLQYCALQIRLFDGSTIRTRFTPDQTITAHVRPWIDVKTNNSTGPYTFKHILTPLPNRPLSSTDEEKSFRELGLAPSSTLVLVPYQGYARAYSSAPGPVARGFSSVYNAVAAFIAMIIQLLSTFLGVGQGNQQRQAAEGESEAKGTGAQENTPDASGSRVRVRTLADQRRDQGKDKTELYNGNQLNFEPRKDEEEDRK